MAVNGDDFETFWRSLVLAALGFVGVSSWAYFLHLTVLRNRITKPAPVPLIVFLGLVAGAFWGIINYFGAPIVDLEVPPRPYAKTIFVAFFGLWWGIGMTLFFEARERFHLARTDLIDKAIQIERLRLHEANIVKAMRKSLTAEVESAVNERLLGLGQKKEFLQPQFPSKNWRNISSYIRATSNISVRPLSHRLMAEKSFQYPRPSVISVVRNVVQTQKFRPFMISVLYIISTGPNDIQAFGDQQGALKILTAIIAISLFFNTANYFMTKFPESHAKIYVVTLFFVELTTIYSSIRRHIALGDDAPLVSILATVLASGTLIIATSAFGSLRSAQRDSLMNFESEIDQQTIEAIARSQQLAEIARETAQTLHGSVQSRLNSCALAIDEASRSGNLKQCSEAFAIALQTLAQPLDAAIISDGLTPEEVVHYVSEPWLGLCDIEVKIDHSFNHVGKLPSKALTYFLEETVCNAIRHGQAQSIFIHIQHIDSEYLSVKVLDDGVGLVATKNTALSPLLKDLTNNTVTIDNHRYGGAVVQAKFAYLSLN